MNKPNINILRSIVSIGLRFMQLISILFMDEYNENFFVLKKVVL